MEEETADQIGIDPIPDAKDLKGEATVIPRMPTKANINRTGKLIGII